MKKLQYLIALPAALLLSNCATPHHYKAHLCKSVSGESTYSITPEGAAYHGKTGENQMVTVRLQEIYMGQLHRKYAGNKNGHPTKANKFSYAGKELWIIAQAVATDSKNPLLESDARYAAATSVKLNQESFSPVPISHKESELFKLPADRDYRVTVKVYEVDKFELKKTLYNARDTDFGKLALTTVQGAWGAIENAFLKSLLSTVRKKYSDDLAVEELILSSGSNLEFKGSFYLYAEKAKDKSSDPDNTSYALVDIIRSYYDHDGNYASDSPAGLKLPPLSNKDQVDGLKRIRDKGKSITLDPTENYRFSQNFEFYQSYVKLGVE